ncbi:glycosyltransferase [Aquimarina hainanensis]|uniref:Glycosyltransferase n=1 Tax=Aquimarina hainanensis TaxID=1578017 RepID=A0ABW5N5F4_9FLAO
MKLALVTAYPPSKVTLNEYAYHLVKHFRQHQDVSEIILLTDITAEAVNTHLESQGCTVTVLPCWKFNSYKNIFSIMKAVKTTEPDAILFNLQFMKFGDKKIPAALGLLAPLFCKLSKIPTIVLLHNIMEEVDLEKAGFTNNFIAKKLYTFIGTTLTKFLLTADIIAVTMQKYVTILQDKYKATNVVLIPHGTFEIPERPIYSLQEGPLKIMTFGKFGTYKKVEILIEAVEKLRSKTGIDVEIVIAGTDNPNARGYLQKMEEKYWYVPQLTFTGYVAEQDVPSLFRESAVVVFPYTATTGSSGVLHQAGSYGKAVVMPDLGDLSLLTKEEGYDGAFFTPEDIDSLANAIKKIITDDTYRIQLGKTNYQAATAYPISTIADMYIKQFLKIQTTKWENELIKIDF